MKIGIYVRFSSRNDGDESLIDQVNSGVNWCDENGYDYQVYDEGLGVSGGLEFDERKVGKDFIKDIKGGLINGVYIKNWSRLIRNRNEGWRLIELFENYDIKLFNNGREVNYKDDGGYYELIFENVRSDRERRMIAYNIRRGKILKLREGEHCMGRWLFGYKKEIEKIGRKKVSKLVRDEVDGDLLDRIFEFFLSGEVGDYRKFSKVCNSKLGLNNNESFYKRIVSKENLVRYSGNYKMSYYKYFDLKEKEKMLYDINAEALISNSLMDKVLSKVNLLRVRRGVYKEYNRSNNIYKGLIFCLGEGRSLNRKVCYNIKTIYKNSKRVRDENLGVKKDENGDVVYIWKTNRQNKNRLSGSEFVDKCDYLTSIGDKVLDRIIRELIFYVWDNSERLKKNFKDKLDSESGIESYYRDLDDYKKYKKDIEDKMKRKNISWENGFIIDEEEYNSSMVRLRNDRDELERKIKVLEDEVDEIRLLSGSSLGWKRDYSEKFSLDRLLNMGDDELRDIVNDLIEKVLIRGRVNEGKYKVKVCFRYKIVNDKKSFDKDNWYKFKKENLKDFKNDKVRFYKNFKRKFNIVDGVDVLELDIDSNKIKKSKNASILIKGFLVFVNFELIISNKKFVDSIDFIGFSRY